MPNRLDRETSPYLLRHADDPVDRRPRPPEAFEEAWRHNVPVLLGVGYAGRHWHRVDEGNQVAQTTEGDHCGGPAMLFGRVPVGAGAAGGAVDPEGRSRAVECGRPGRDRVVEGYPRAGEQCLQVGQLAGVEGSEDVPQSLSAGLLAGRES
ncbi:thioredoxin domain-containing protein [Streptomyces sp. NBC_01217]|nr:thioredoxin domain-containing protein [Streptomyces sp. NBC_01217]